MFNFFYLKPKQHPAKLTSSFGFHHYLLLVFLLLLWSFLLSIGEVNSSSRSVQHSGLE